MKLGLGLTIHNSLLGAQAPSVVYDGNTVGWYIANDLNTITKDVSDLVSAWDDKLGSGHDLVQVVGTNQPLWTSDGILFDGIDNFMKASAFTLNQPEMIYMVIKQSTWTNERYFFDGNSNNSGMVRQNLATPGIRAFAGIFSSQESNLTLNTFGILRVLFNGASSKMIIDNNTPIVGDFGAANMGGFTLGAIANGSINYGNIQVKEIILRKVADGATDEANIYNYLSKKYGI